MISIIMPVYNSAAYLKDTVQSVMAQTHADWELILVDDGATDGSGQLCDRLAAGDSRIRVIHKNNGGVASARNAGLDAARGAFIGWVDSDDLIHPKMFERMLTLAEQYGADLVQCSHTRKPEELNDSPTPIEVLGNLDSLKRIYRSHYTNSCALWSKIFRRSLFDGLRFTEGAAFEDDEIVPRLLERSRVSVFFEEKLYCYVKRQESIITAPKVENILALTGHLESRMLRFETLEKELYGLATKHFFGYLKGKVCEQAFRNTPVQKQAIQMLKKHSRRFRPIASRYDRIAMVVLRCGVVRWVADSGFEPVQLLIERLRSGKMKK